jgi:nitrogen regulatory protein P-II 1
VKKIEATIRFAKLELVKAALAAEGVEGMTITEVFGTGRQQGPTITYRGTDRHVDQIPRVKIEIVVEDDDVPHVLDAIYHSAHTGDIGDGRIYVLDVVGGVRIRTGEMVHREEHAVV